MNALPQAAGVCGEAGYTTEVDSVSRAQWAAILGHFADASLYQTWAYESVRSGEARLSHFVLRDRGRVVAAAQLRVVRLPMLRFGVAYVRWGPMWKPHGAPPDPRVLAAALAGLRAEYVTRRGLCLRILPYLHQDEDQALDAVLRAQGFERLHAEAPQRTLLLPLAPSITELRAGLDQKWRNCLNKAQRNGLVLEEGDDDGLFERFEGIHAEMVSRKQFTPTSDVREFRAMQRDLPGNQKMRVFLATSGEGLAAGVVCSRLGDFGVFLHGATSNAGMATKAAYLLQWRAIEWLKAGGARYYNLHGINPLTNPGTYHFKAGLCGRQGRDLHYLGSYQAASTQAMQLVIQAASSTWRAARQGRTTLQQLLRRWGPESHAPRSFR